MRSTLPNHFDQIARENPERFLNKVEVKVE
jgi:hypothetical protein